MRFKGYADRVDSLDDGKIRVVDYKTGTAHLEFAGLTQLFCGEAKQRLSNFINTLLYAMMLRYEYGRDAVPALYYVRKMADSGYSPLIIDKSRNLSGVPYSEYAAEFEEYVGANALRDVRPDRPVPSERGRRCLQQLRFRRCLRTQQAIGGFYCIR